MLVLIKTVVKQILDDLSISYLDMNLDGIVFYRCTTSSPERSFIIKIKSDTITLWSYIDSIEDFDDKLYEYKKDDNPDKVVGFEIIDDEISFMAQMILDEFNSQQTECIRKMIEQYSLIIQNDEIEKFVKSTWN